MRFLSATTDVAFKRLFGNQGQTDLTISFLNNILERKEGELITEITINDVANYPILLGKKTSFVDVSCSDQTGKKYIIEVQVVNEHNFIERAQYYTSYFLTRQLEHKDFYTRLVPVIFIGVASYDLFKHTDYLSHHVIMDTKHHEHTMHHLEFHFIELSKFHKTIDELANVADKWIYLLKHAENIEKVPDQLKTPHEMAEAFGILERIKWTEAEFQAYLVELDQWRRTEGALHDMRHGLEKEIRREVKEEIKQEVRQEVKEEVKQEVRREVKEEVKQEVRREVKEELKQEVREEVKQQVKEEVFDSIKLEMARNMLVDGLSIERVSAITGLSIDQIKS
jgi:predicted transposase/invertase (TIGR01784 family)